MQVTGIMISEEQLAYASYFTRTQLLYKNSVTLQSLNYFTKSQLLYEDSVTLHFASGDGDHDKRRAARVRAPEGQAGGPLRSGYEPCVCVCVSERDVCVCV